MPVTEALLDELAKIPNFFASAQNIGDICGTSWTALVLRMGFAWRGVCIILVEAQNTEERTREEENNGHDPDREATQLIDAPYGTRSSTHVGALR